MLADGEVLPFDERGIDLPAVCRQPLLDRRERAEHDAMAHADQTPAPVPFDHLCIEQVGPRHPAGLGRGALCPLARQVDQYP
jgi:hypothetical protein